MDRRCVFILRKWVGTKEKGGKGKEREKEEKNEKRNK